MSLCGLCERRIGNRLLSAALSDDFVEENRGGGGDIQGVGLAEHGDADTLIAFASEDRPFHDVFTYDRFSSVHRGGILKPICKL